MYKSWYLYSLRFCIFPKRRNTPSSHLSQMAYAFILFTLNKSFGHLSSHNKITKIRFNLFRVLWVNMKNGLRGTRVPSIKVNTLVVGGGFIKYISQYKMYYCPYTRKIWYQVFGETAFSLWFWVFFLEREMSFIWQNI